MVSSRAWTLSDVYGPLRNGRKKKNFSKRVTLDERQVEQVRDCTAEGKADILVVGTVSFEGLTPTILEISERLPVVAECHVLHAMAAADITLECL